MKKEGKEGEREGEGVREGGRRKEGREKRGLALRWYGAPEWLMRP